MVRKIRENIQCSYAKLSIITKTRNIWDVKYSLKIRYWFLSTVIKWLDLYAAVEVNTMTVPDVVIDEVFND